MFTTLQLIELEEGYREKAYYCSEGYPTIAIGKRIGRHKQSLSDFELISVPKTVAYEWLECDLQSIINQLSATFSWFDLLGQPRKDIVISMCYQLGFDGFCKFKQTIKHIESGSFVSAAHEMLNSKWAKQTPARAHRHSKVIAAGDWSAAEEYQGIGD